MLKSYVAIRATAKAIDAAVLRVVAALRAGRVEQEPAFTDRMLQSIENTLDGQTVRGVRWEAKTLTDRGPNSQERQFGADFMGVLSVRLPGYSIDKGFLAQAKILRPGRSVPTSQLLSQCRLMLDLTPTAFVFLYRPSGVRIVSASAVAAASGGLLNHYEQSPQRFFGDHLMCRIGDDRIRAPTTAHLSAMASEMDSRTALLLRASPINQ